MCHWGPAPKQSVFEEASAPRCYGIETQTNWFPGITGQRSWIRLQIRSIPTSQLKNLWQNISMNNDFKSIRTLNSLSLWMFGKEKMFLKTICWTFFQVKKNSRHIFKDWSSFWVKAIFWKARVGKKSHFSILIIYRPFYLFRIFLAISVRRGRAGYR